MALEIIDAIPRNDLSGRAVLVRVDSQDELFLRDALPTLALAAEANARVIVATHAGVPPGAPYFDVAAQLSDMLGRPVGRLAGWRGEAALRSVARLNPGQIAVLENLPDKSGRPEADEELADALAALAEIFCNEAFSLAHEAWPSTVGVAKKTGHALAGIAFGRQFHMLEFVLGQPRPPSLAVLGGAVSKERLLLAEEIADRSDETLIGGELALAFLAAREIVRNHPPVSDEMVVIAERMMAAAREKKHRLATPVDFTVADQETFARLRRGESVARPRIMNVSESDLSAHQVIVDIGTATRWSWSERFGPARTIFWHGPLGICEIVLFCQGTQFLATALAERTWPTLHRTLVCGASLVDGLRSCGFVVDRLRHVTRAGEPALRYRAGQPLPAVEVLSRADAADRHPSCVLIPLNGSERDAISLHAVAELAPRQAELVLLHVRPGLDEEQYPGVALGLDRADQLQRQIESQRIFSRANAELASRGLLSQRQLAVQGPPTEVILRYAERLKADMIVVAAAQGLKAMGWRRMVDRAPNAALVARPR